MYVDLPLHCGLNDTFFDSFGWDCYDSNLSFNKIEDFDSSVFDSVDTLESIYLAHNSLTTVKDGYFSGLTKLITL